MSMRKILVTCGIAALSGSFTLSALPTAQAAGVGSVRAVTALGDSYPSGAMGNEGNSYVNRYGRRAGQRQLNWSFSGWRTGDVLYQLNSSAQERRNLHDSRTVIVTIGANDISETYPDPSPAANSFAPYNGELHAMRSRLHSILGTISHARGGNNSRVVVTGYNNIYTDGAVLNRQTYAYRSGAIRLTQQVNAVIMAECRAYRMTCVDVAPAFHSVNTTNYVTYDGTHPNSNGHQRYANLIYSRVGS